MFFNDWFPMLLAGTSPSTEVLAELLRRGGQLQKRLQAPAGNGGGGVALSPTARCEHLRVGGLVHQCHFPTISETSCGTLQSSGWADWLPSSRSSSGLQHWGPQHLQRRPSQAEQWFKRKYTPDGLVEMVPAESLVDFSFGIKMYWEFWGRRGYCLVYFELFI